MNENNNLITLKKDLKILKNMCLKLNEVVKNEFYNEGVWENIEFRYNGTEHGGHIESEYRFDEISIDDMAQEMKEYNFPLHESNLSFGVKVYMKQEFISKHINIKKLSSNSIDHIINNRSDFDIETIINSMKYETLLLEEGLKVQKKLENKGFKIYDLETYEDGIWIVVMYNLKKYFERNKKAFFNINK